MKTATVIPVLIAACAIAVAQQPASVANGDVSATVKQPTTPRKTVSGVAPVGMLCASSATPEQSDSRPEVTRNTGSERLCGLVNPPSYPIEAKKQGIQGTVHLNAVIGADGIIRELRAIDGHPMLVPAAMDAVKRWKYKPFYENGKPIEVQTTIAVNFTLDKHN